MIMPLHFNCYCVVLIIVLFQSLSYFAVSQNQVYLSETAIQCDEEAALQCEYEFLICKLGGPANDRDTLCTCAADYYGKCLRLAGCEISKEVGPLTKHEIYMKQCVAFIMENNCPNPLICSINCASDANIDVNKTKILPFNNFGTTYLRIRTCIHKVHQNKLDRYSYVDVNPCDEPSEFQSCARYISPQTFVPVALPIDTTYIEIDECVITQEVDTGGINTVKTFRCLPETPKRIYGNQKLFPRSYNVEQTRSSTCVVDANCTGSFCDKRIIPPKCSPKILEQALGEGKDYFFIR